ncbi:MAG: dihydroorotase [Alphaproteobacteria bacterium]|nr:dihydroorotase [Alphaproteobacteria bacterium]
MNTYDVIVRGGTVVSHRGIGRADVGMRAGKIVAIGSLTGAPAAEVVAAEGLHVLPGVIDTQVHFREPGMEGAEDLESGTRGAVLGGITAVFEMPNTRPMTVDPAAFADKMTRAKGRAWCDYAFYLGGTAQNADQLFAWENMAGCCGIKVFMGASTGDLLVPDDAALERIMRSGRRRIAIHAEDNFLLEAQKDRRGHDVHNHPMWRDELSAIQATQRLLRLARASKRRVHVLHVTTAEEMDILAEHKDIASVEVTPQHLTLAAPDCYDRLGTYAQMNPPIRAARHRDGLWQALQAGVPDMIGSDHAPHPKANKDKIYPDSPSGMPGVQTLLPVMLDHVAAGRLTLHQLIDLVCAGPARVFGMIGKGRVAVGNDADLTLVDLNARRTIEAKWIASKCGWTPYDGMRITGWPMMTIIRGRTVMRDGVLQGPPAGKPLRFEETLRPA